jgi:hypothetical protein
MKTKFLVSMIVTACAFAGCSDDDKKNTGIQGEWDVIAAVGVEWQENAGNTGAGTVIDTNDPDVDMIGEMFTIEGDEITLFGDSFPFEYSDGVLTIDFGGGDTESFNVELSGTKTMYWTQDDPDEHSDYEENNPGQFLFYQKTFTLERH